LSLGEYGEKGREERKVCSNPCPLEKKKAKMCVKNRDRVEFDAVLKEGRITVVSLLCLLVTDDGNDHDDDDDDKDDGGDDNADNCTCAERVGLFLLLVIAIAAVVSLFAIARLQLALTVSCLCRAGLVEVVFISLDAHIKSIAVASITLLAVILGRNTAVLDNGSLGINLGQKMLRSTLTLTVQGITLGANITVSSTVAALAVAVETGGAPCCKSNRDKSKDHKKLGVHTTNNNKEKKTKRKNKKAQKMSWKKNGK